VRLVKPWLHKTHRNFFVIYTATIVFHLWCAANAFFGPDRWFELETLEFVNKAAGNNVWGAVNLVVAVGLYAGLYTVHFDRYARVALAAGFLWVMFRFILVMIGLASGNDAANSLPNLFLCAMVHMAQTLEPPSNPATTK
jgi:hypothetical protein